MILWGIGRPSSKVWKASEFPIPEELDPSQLACFGQTEIQEVSVPPLFSKEGTAGGIPSNSASFIDSHIAEIFKGSFNSA